MAIQIINIIDETNALILFLLDRGVNANADLAAITSMSEGAITHRMLQLEAAKIVKIDSNKRSNKYSLTLDGEFMIKQSYLDINQNFFEIKKKERRRVL